ncbi:MAG: hypothetical protein ACYC96_02000 [Fimbriimonadaceae bacterium]
MRILSTKLAVLGLMGVVFAVPAASQADAIRVNLFGLHIAIGHTRRPDDCYNWQWRRDHGYRDWQWYRDHPGYRGDRDDRRDRGDDRRARDDRGRQGGRRDDRRDRR